ncbi:MAG: hypothetical protein WBA17_09535 [Saprospiraceae bacterium]
MRFTLLITALLLMATAASAQIAVAPAWVSLQKVEIKGNVLTDLTGVNITEQESRGSLLDQFTTPDEGIPQYFDHYQAILNKVLARLAKEQSAISDDIVTYEEFSEDEQEEYRRHTNLFQFSVPASKSHKAYAAQSRAQLAPYSNQLADRLGEDFFMRVILTGKHYVKRKMQDEPLPVDATGNFLIEVVIYDGGTGLYMAKEDKFLGNKYEPGRGQKPGNIELTEEKLTGIIEKLVEKALKNFEREMD